MTFRGLATTEGTFRTSVVYPHSSFAMHKLSFACMKTKFSPVGDIILDCQCQCQRIVKKISFNPSLC